jgi:ATP-dependent Clp protease ATP-binding subunit ClpA
MTTFGKYIHAIIQQGRDEARKDGSAAVEAQHLLLAIAIEQEATTHQVLTSAGLDLRAIRDALDREFERSLSAVGVSAAAFDLPMPSSAPERPQRLGASARLAIERGFTSAARKKDLQPVNLLIGILQAEVGTVPRALSLAGTDRAGLAERARQALAGTGG